MTFEMDCIEFIAKWVARSLQGPKGYLPHVKIASLTVAQKFMSYLDEGVVTDLQKLKDIEFQKLQGEADKVTAEAQEASNRATLGFSRDKISQLEREKKQAEIDEKNANTQAAIMDAETRRMDAETRRIEAETKQNEADTRRRIEVEEANARLKEAISILKLHGGAVFARRDGLRDIISFNQGADLDVLSIENEPEEK